MSLQIFCDGACRGNGKENGGIGAWAFVAVKDGNEVAVKSGFQPDTTNNKMELAAVIVAMEWLSELPQPHYTTIYCDSQYVVYGITQWIHGWIKKNWMLSPSQPVKNQEEWKKLHELKLKCPMVQFVWVRGHDGNKYNELCDQLCNKTLDGATQHLI